MKNFFRRSMLAALSLLVVQSVHAYPERHITLVVGWAAGGSTDVLARIIAAKLTEKLGQSVIVVNKPGASGTIGAHFVANEKPDGYTMYYGTNSTYALAPWLYKSLPYDFNKSFEAVSFVGSMPMIFGVNPAVPAKTVREFIEIAKQKPRGLTFGSSSAGATSHIAAELLMAQTATELMHVPYKGGGPAMAALLSGEIDVLFNDVATLKPLIEAGRVRGLAVTSLTRLPNIPELPTVTESGVPGFEIATTNAIFAPKGVSAEIIERFRSALVSVLSEPAVVQELLDRGMVVQSSTPSELAAQVRGEQQKWRTLLQDRGITLSP